MRTRKIKATQNKKTPVRRERERISRKYVVLTAFCGLLLAAGFFGAARQHFSSIDYGIKNAKLKKQIEELKSEQRRLRLNREVALSPSEIKKSAKKIGFREMTASNIQSFKAETISAVNTGAVDPIEKPPFELSLNKSLDELRNNSQSKQSEPKKAVDESKKIESAENIVKKS